jgi:hypothetical protein
VGGASPAVEVAAPHVMIGQAEVPAPIIREGNAVPGRRGGTNAGAKIAAWSDLQPGDRGGIHGSAGASVGVGRISCAPCVGGGGPVLPNAEETLHGSWQPWAYQSSLSQFSNETGEIGKQGGAPALHAFKESVEGKVYA